METYYTKMYYTKNQRQEFKDFMVDTDYSEELLKAHEDKLEDLKFRYEESEELYTHVAEWLQLWAEFIEFEEKSKDPNRFKQRGFNSLDEEKKRKHFHQNFPKLEKELTARTAEYEDRNGGEQFEIYGSHWKTYIQDLKNDYEQFKKNEKKEKAILRDKNTTMKVTTPSILKTTNRILKRKNEPQTPIQAAVRSSKFQRLDEKTITNSPMKKVLSTRKSRTPLKKRLRRSKVSNLTRAEGRQSSMAYALFFLIITLLNENFLI